MIRLTPRNLLIIGALYYWFIHRKKDGGMGGGSGNGSIPLGEGYP